MFLKPRLQTVSRGFASISSHTHTHTHTHIYYLIHVHTHTHTHRYTCSAGTYKSQHRERDYEHISGRTTEFHAAVCYDSGLLINVFRSGQVPGRQSAPPRCLQLDQLHRLHHMDPILYFVVPCLFCFIRPICEDMVAVVFMAYK